MGRNVLGCMQSMGGLARALGSPRAKVSFQRIGRSLSQHLCCAQSLAGVR